jgi:hypothetical protein
MNTRNGHKVEVAGASHSVYVSRLKDIAAVIEEAAVHIHEKKLVRCRWVRERRPLTA